MVSLSKIGIFGMVFKRLCKESFEDIEFNITWEFQTCAALSHKNVAHKSFSEITQVPWETSVGFLKCVNLQLFPKYSQSYLNLNVKK